MKRKAVHYLASAVIVAYGAYPAHAENLLAQGSINCYEGRKIMKALSQYTGPITDSASCNAACAENRLPENHGCFQVCRQCYQNVSENSGESERSDSDIYPSASKTERKLLQYLIKNGEKTTNELGRTYTLKLNEKAGKKLKFSAVVRSAKWEKACGLKISEKDGSMMPAMNLIMSGNEKSCRKLKPGKTIVVTPASLNYVFMPFNPFTKKSNDAFLAVTGTSK